MDRVTLGRTGLSVSVAGLGGGGFSQLGLATGGTRDAAGALVRRAVELGVNFFDTAESYRTEEALGDGLAGVDRSSVVISTKYSWWRKEGGLRPVAELEPALDASLRKLRTDRVDLYHLHGLSADAYPQAVAELVPELRRLKAKGKIGWIGVTEAFESDRGHAMLSRAVADGWPDVVMVGFNILNPSARERVFAAAAAQGIGTLVMFAVRNAFSKPARLAEILAELRSRGRLGPGLDEGAGPLGFATRDGGAATLAEAAYRFCRHEPGAHVTLFGTGSAAHLEDNVRALAAPPLPAPVLARLRTAFSRVDDVSGQ